MNDELFLEQLSQQSLLSLSNYKFGTSPRDSQLLQQVVGAGGTEEGYLYGGFTTMLGLVAALATVGRPIDGFSTILDFGCGSARVVRWLKHLSASASLNACDISPEAIEWCTANNDRIEFFCNGYKPPLPFTSNSLDLIYGISVVTHLDEEYQSMWLAELHRVSAPGAVVMLSVHGEDKSQMVLPAWELAQFSRDGFLYKKVDDHASVEGLPDFYQVAFHSDEYIRREWSRYFEFVARIKHGPFYEQELIVMLKPRADGNDGAVEPRTRTIDLPITCIDQPKIGESIENSELTLSGWAFLPHGHSPLVLTAWVDGSPIGELQTGLIRPDVQAVFADNENAAASGFSSKLTLQLESQGVHRLWLTAESSLFPICGTLFVS